ncbi:leucine rich repeat protein [Leptospira santarosai str. HAI821]|uniref:leucine-rich repeat domain-containing protein n=1 Tax=Leptospira santarosai TaxID=28183 RepID=UPI0002BFD03D|nr:leucine-rich repeat domain-containing protein [Leptospira santarosai]EMO33460.1 leucine rich repeat protein [Leptospira santarosai str. HAI821]
MKKYLTYQDEGSNKFWSIDVSGSTFTVTFGKVGSSGQSSVKTFHDEQECLKEAEKLLREKLKKGYVEAEWPEQKTEAVLKFLSDSFHRFLKTKVKDFEESKYAKAFQKINWEKEADQVFQSVCSYWAKLAKKNPGPIGIFDIRWDDSATQYSIEFDYDTESNDPKNAMEEGCVDNEPVIDFSNLIRKDLKEEPEGIWETMGEDYTVLQNILCRMSTEVILHTLKEDVFLQIQKQTPYYLMFAYYHDEESTVIFDSSGKIRNSLYPELEKKSIDLNKLYDSEDQSIYVDDRKLEEIPDEIGNYRDLETLSLYTNVAKLPNTIGTLKNLSDLTIYSKKLAEFPIEICKLINLKYLYIRTEKIDKLPEDIGNLVSLNHLDLCGNKLKDLPKSIQKLTLLKQLNLGENQFETIPTALYGMNSIEELDIRNNPFKNLDGIGNMAGLKNIQMDSIGIQELTPEIGQLKSCEYFDLNEVEIEEIPKEIGDMDSMYSLTISKTKVRSLPDTIGKLKNCKRLDIQHNQIESLPPTIGSMERLEELYAGYNKLTDLPESIYQLKKLKEINLWGNSFSPNQKAKILSRLKETIPGIKISIEK